MIDPGIFNLNPKDQISVYKEMERRAGESIDDILADERRRVKLVTSKGSLLSLAPVATTPIMKEQMPGAPVLYGAKEAYANTFSTSSGGGFKIRHKSPGIKTDKGRFKVGKRINRAKSSSSTSNENTKTTKKDGKKKKRPYPYWLKEFQFKKGGKK